MIVMIEVMAMKDIFETYMLHLLTARLPYEY